MASMRVVTLLLFVRLLAWNLTLNKTESYKRSLIESSSTYVFWKSFQKESLFVYQQRNGLFCFCSNRRSNLTQFLLLLSGDIEMCPGPVRNVEERWINYRLRKEWNFFIKTWGDYFTTYRFFQNSFKVFKTTLTFFLYPRHILQTMIAMFRYIKFRGTRSLLKTEQLVKEEVLGYISLTDTTGSEEQI